MVKRLELGNATVPTAYQPLMKNVSSAELPPAITAMLARNAEYSRFFIGKKDERAKFFREHDFQLVVNDCIDERRARTAQSLGEGDLTTDGPVPPGSTEIVRGAGSRISFRSQAAASLEMKRIHRLKSAFMRELRMPLAHWSSSRPNSASCAAFAHDTKAAVEYVRDFSAKMNYIFRGTCVAAYALADTDDDALIVFGPNGSVDTAESVDDENDGERLISWFEERLSTIFPKTWEPLTALGKPRLAESFHRQMAEHLAYNVGYVRANRETPREQQRFDHSARYILIGRHLESETLHGAAFAISDLDADFNRCLAIALRYVGKNVIAETEADPDWTVRLHVNIPHNGDEEDRRMTVEYARETALRAIERAIKIKKTLAHFWLSDEHGVPKKLRRTVEQQIEEDLERHLAITISISDRDDRLFRIIDKIGR